MKSFLTLLFLLPHVCLYSAVFTSNGTGGGNWNLGSTWDQSGATPTGVDDVIILDGDVINFTSNVQCNDITVSGTLTANLPYTIRINGNTEIESTGNIVGSTYMIFWGTGGETVGGTGNHGEDSFWQFQLDKVVNPEVNIKKNVDVRVSYVNTTVNNFGNIHFGRKLKAADNTNVWRNENGAVSTFSDERIFIGKGMVDATEPGNLVEIDFNTGLSLPSRFLNNEFANLSSIKSGQTPVLNNNTVVKEDLILLNGAGFNLSTFSLSIAGNLTNNGGNLSNGTSINFNGVGTQDISNTTLQNFPCEVNIESSSYVTLSSDARFNQNLTIDGSLDMNTANNIFIVAGLNINGSFIHQNKTVEFLGSSNQPLNIAGTTEFYDIHMNKSNNFVNLNSGNATLKNEIRFTKGKVRILGSSTFTLISDIDGTARVDELPNTNSGFLGNVRVQRFLNSGNGGWADICSPVRNAKASEWADDIIIGGPTTNGWAGCAYGGCMVTCQRYDANTGQYVILGSTANDIYNTLGYETLIADDLADETNFSLSAPVTLETSGSINNSPDISVTTFGTWNLIGNPYASNINFDNINRSGQGNFYYAYNNLTKSFDYYQIGNVSSPLSNIINSHQGFWINGAGTITWQQSDKTDQTASFVRHHNSLNNTLSIKISNERKASCSLTYSGSNFASNRQEITDVPSFTPGRADKKAVINIYGYTSDGEKLRYFTFNNSDDFSSIIGIETTSSGEYSVDFNLDNFSSYDCITLKDIVTGSEYDLKETPTIKIYLSKQNTSTSRFKIFFNKNCDKKNITNSFSIKDLGEQLQIYTSDVINNATLNIYNAVGQLIYNKSDINLKEGLNTEKLPLNLKGTLLIELKTENDTKILKLYR